MGPPYTSKWLSNNLTLNKFSQGAASGYPLQIPKSDALRRCSSWISPEPLIREPDNLELEIEIDLGMDDVPTDPLCIPVEAAASPLRGLVQPDIAKRPESSSEYGLRPHHRNKPTPGPGMAARCDAPQSAFVAEEQQIVNPSSKEFVSSRVPRGDPITIVLSPLARESPLEKQDAAKASSMKASVETAKPGLYEKGVSQDLPSSAGARDRVGCQANTSAEKSPAKACKGILEGKHASVGAVSVASGALKNHQCSLVMQGQARQSATAAQKVYAHTASEAAIPCVALFYHQAQDWHKSS